MLDASDVTYNYRRSGRIVRNFEVFLPFFNAAIQSLDKTARTMKETIQAKGGLAGAGVAAEIAKKRIIALAITSGIYMAARAMLGDDEEQPEWLRFGYITAGHSR